MEVAMFDRILHGRGVLSNEQSRTAASSLKLAAREKPKLKLLQR
jgi:hypothetical protein